MSEEQRDIICKLAWLVFRIESRKTTSDQRDQYVQEMNQQAAKLNALCNPPNRRTKREAVSNG